MESGEGIPLYAHKDQENAWKRQEAIMASHNENTVEWLDAKTDQENLKNRYTPEFEIPQNVTFVGTLNMDATTNDLSPKVIDRSCIIKVTKDVGETLCPFEQGVMTLEEMQGEDSFEKQLLKALKKDVSNRVERQRVRMRERLKSEGGQALAKVARIDVSGMNPLLKECHIQVACDVNNPLCGENGSTYVYGPQKGVTEDMKKTLDEAMAHFARVTSETLENDYMNTPGAGAAGGLGYAFLAKKS